MSSITSFYVPHQTHSALVFNSVPLTQVSASQNVLTPVHSRNCWGTSTTGQFSPAPHSFIIIGIRLLAFKQKNHLTLKQNLLLWQTFKIPGLISASRGLCYITHAPSTSWLFRKLLPHINLVQTAPRNTKSHLIYASATRRQPWVNGLLLRPLSG